MGELSEFLQMLQAGSVPVLGAIAYLLWKIDRRMDASTAKLESTMAELRISVETAVETLMRFVPGHRKE